MTVVATRLGKTRWVGHPQRGPQPRQTRQDRGPLDTTTLELAGGIIALVAVLLGTGWLLADIVLKVAH